MRKREREKAFNEYAKRGERELAGLMVQSDEHIERLNLRHGRRLNELKDMIAELRSALQEMLDCPAGTPWVKAYERARAAIAKSEGR